jgi:hypothetical protein
LGREFRHIGSGNSRTGGGWRVLILRFRLTFVFHCILKFTFGNTFGSVVELKNALVPPPVGEEQAFHEDHGKRLYRRFTLVGRRRRRGRRADV